MIDILSYLPEMLREIKEFAVILGAVNEALDAFAADADAAFCAQFAEDADGNGIRRLARGLGLSATGEEADIRFAVRAALQEKRPYTYENLTAYLQAVVGADGYAVERQFGANGGQDTLTVRLALRARRQLDTVAAFLDAVVPANMTLITGLLYNPYGTVNRQATYGFLKQYTWYALRNDAAPAETLRARKGED
ncbi:MAG: hypothetical protein IJ766_01285 [Clostridia bacterium]|nr:hypothetical protein [Clostridia bacterium]